MNNHVQLYSFALHNSLARIRPDASVFVYCYHISEQHAYVF